MTKQLHLLFFLIIISLIFNACASKSTVNSFSNNALKQSLEQLVDALNKKDLQLLQSIYSDHIKSLSPILKNIDKKQLIDQTIRNFKKHNFEVKIDILDIQEGKKIGYAVLNWYLIEKNNQGEYQSAIPSKRLTIWEKEKGKWVLVKSLFYEEKEF